MDDNTPDRERWAERVDSGEWRQTGDHMHYWRLTADGQVETCGCGDTEAENDE